MRFIIDNIITQDDAEYILKNHPGRYEFSHPSIKKITKEIGKALVGDDYTLDKPSYIRVECKQSEHDWHIDTGSTNHMPWCNYGVSILLTEPEEGGLFKYKEPYQEITQKEHYLNAIIHTSDEMHKRDACTGKRTVLLMFLGGE